jgi:nucleoside-diphosphate-sugar epimerase
VAGIVITGASGLIGRRLLEAFHADPPETPLVALGRADVDLLAPGAWVRLLDEFSPDTVIHLAWSASGMPDYRNHDDNWRWAETTIEAAAIAAERGIQFLGTGTAIDTVPEDAYSRSKSAVREALAKPIAAGDLAWLRPFYVFDEVRPSPALLKAALAAKSAGEPVALASPRARHDYVHARDVGTAFRTVVRAGLTGALDIGSGSLVAVADFVEAYGCDWVAGGAPPPPAARSDAVADVTALRAAGWQPDATNARLRLSAH